MVTRPSTSILAITSGLSDQCSGTLVGSIPYPSGYTSYLTNPQSEFNVYTHDSSKSRTIHGVNSTKSACNGNAGNNTAMKQLSNTMVIIMMIFIGLTETVSSNKVFNQDVLVKK